MDLHLTNKLALITGSTKGIGKQLRLKWLVKGPMSLSMGAMKPK